MTTNRRRRHTPEQIVRKLRHADAMPNAGKDQAAVLQMLYVIELAPVTIPTDVNCSRLRLSKRKEAGHQRLEKTATRRGIHFSLFSRSTAAELDCFNLSFLRFRKRVGDPTGGSRRRAVDPHEFPPGCQVT